MAPNDRYRIVELRAGVELLAIPEDPVSVLRNVASEEFKEASMKELRKAALEEAHEQTDEHIR